MKAASIQEIKQELVSLPPKEVLELCLRLVRYKKENKELLTYLLFEAHDLHSFIDGVKKEITEGFTELPKASAYLTKKSLRKILRALSKYAKHSASKQAEAEMLIWFCSEMKNSSISFKYNTMLTNLYLQQLKKIVALIATLHEDLHYDYTKQVEALQLNK